MKRKKKTQHRKVKKERRNQHQFPIETFRWVTPVKAKDFSEIVAKGGKQRFQAKIWMQKSGGCPGFFKINKKKKKKKLNKKEKEKEKEKENN